MVLNYIRNHVKVFEYISIVLQCISIHFNIFQNILINTYSIGMHFKEFQRYFKGILRNLEDIIMYITNVKIIKV